MLRRFHRISNAARKYGQRKEALQSVGQRNQSSIRPRGTVHSVQSVDTQAYRTKTSEIVIPSYRARTCPFLR